MTVENVMYSPTTRYKQNITNRVNKGGEQSPVSWTRHACNSAPNGPNDFKFCIQGTFVGYNWVLVISRSCDLYRDWTCSGLQIWLASIEVTWPWLDQNSIVTHKAPSMQNFKSFGLFGAELQAPFYPRNWTLLPPF